ncbi:SRPBCC domain-containing protein [Ottowia sp.]|uniref:SRPBCC family protein n=1 Tax=Ottowia sp. TaxID=1898956 RepID=UPI002C16BA0D|nr:SRPBCC domain-containing protein [Ottowia sp.]HNR84145.1 SRPBCC domain-containing protein [Ottowia sp.]HNT85681.1 SRPBCC domain-containing protein [Ottowia sp.]
MKRATLLALAALLPLAAQAELSQVSAQGFVASFRDEVKASPDAVWQAIVQLPRWWNGSHTYSGKADNLSLDLRAGGCWCERWDGGAVQHAQVVLVMPGRLLRLHGGLGPLQDLPVQGVLNLGIGQQDGKTVLRLHYRVGGPADAALDKLAGPVNGVLAEQFQRLKSLVETGSPG